MYTLIFQVGSDDGLVRSFFDVLVAYMEVFLRIHLLGRLLLFNYFVCVLVE